MKPSKTGIPSPWIVTADDFLKLTGLGMTTRWLRQLGVDGHVPRVSNGCYDFIPTLQALIAYFKNADETLAEKKKAIAAEDLRKKMRENDKADALLIAKADVVAEFRKTAEPIKALLRQKLENEYPLAVAGLDVPQARIYGKRLEDEILKEMQSIYSKLGV